MEQEKYKKIQEGTQKVLEESKKETKPYFHEVCSENFIVLPNVFSPKYFEDTEFFAKEVNNYMRNNHFDSFAELGAGTGAISCIVSKNNNLNNHVVTDINPQAVKNSKLNILLHGLGIGSREGDIYKPIGEQEKFDVIFWNAPFGDYAPEKIGFLEQAVFDPGYIKLEKFIAGAQNHLNKEGTLLIGFSKDLGKFDVLEKLLSKYGFVPPKLIAESRPSYEGNEDELIKFHLFETKSK